jgi:aminobenzoyl-glutamate utilization protein B
MEEEMQQQVNTWIEKELPVLTAMADDIFDHPEIGPHEVYSHKVLTSYLEAHGFTVTHGLGGLETAFKAVWQHGEGGPNIGLLCEFDALAGMGHGCGHHMQGPAILGAACALKEAAGDKPFTLTVYGTPGEENISGKYIMIQNGITFEELDVALMMHGGPATQTDIKCLACADINLVFHGKAAHAALKPEAGRSSLDATMLAFHALECLREHVPGDVKIHYNIMDTGGTKANVVPSYTQTDLYVRADTVGTVKSVLQRVEKIVRGAELMTETTADFTVSKILDNKIPNLTLNDILMKHACSLGAPNCQEPRKRTGSTDFANVMHRVPGSCIRVAFVPDGTASHSQAFIDAGKSEKAHQAVKFGAQILADTCLELIYHPEELKAVKEEFQTRLAKEQAGEA